MKLKVLRSDLDWWTSTIVKERVLVKDNEEELINSRDALVKECLGITWDDQISDYMGKTIYRLNRDEVMGLNVLSDPKYLRVDFPGSCFLGDLTTQKKLLKFYQDNYDASAIGITRLDFAVDFLADSPLDILNIENRSIKHTSKHWRASKFYNFNQTNIEHNSLYMGTSQRHIKIYNKMKQNEFDKNVYKKTYYENLYAGKNVQRLELSLRSTVYTKKIKDLLLSGEMREAGKVALINFLERHRITHSASGRTCSKYLALLEAVKGL